MELPLAVLSIALSLVELVETLGFDKLNRRVDKLNRRVDKLNRRVDKLNRRSAYVWASCVAVRLRRSVRGEDSLFIRVVSPLGRKA